MSDKLAEFLSNHDWKLLQTIKGWRVERDEVNADVIRLTLPARDGEVFSVRFVCDGYPDQAPRVAFVNASGSTEAKSSWPAGDTAFHQVVKLPPESFLCTDLTREGFAHHSDWVNKPSAWRGATHTLMDLFNYIQDDLLNSPNYLGRAK